jgi:hypothetical protein
MIPPLFSTSCLSRLCGGQQQLIGRAVAYQAVFKGSFVCRVQQNANYSSMKHPLSPCFIIPFSSYNICGFQLNWAALAFPLQNLCLTFFPADSLTNVDISTTVRRHLKPSYPQALAWGQRALLLSLAASTTSWQPRKHSCPPR